MNVEPHLSPRVRVWLTSSPTYGKRKSPNRGRRVPLMSDVFKGFCEVLDDSSWEGNWVIEILNHPTTFYICPRLRIMECPVGQPESGLPESRLPLGIRTAGPNLKPHASCPGITKKKRTNEFQADPTTFAQLRCARTAIVWSVVVHSLDFIFLRVLRQWAQTTYNVIQRFTYIEGPSVSERLTKHTSHLK